MAARITEQERQEMIAAHVNGESYRSIARRYGRSNTSIRRICEEDPEIVQKITQKKENITKDVLSGMDSMRDDILAVIERGTAHVLEIIGDANLRDTGTVVGIYMDKALRLAEQLRSVPDTGSDGGGVIVLGSGDVGEE